MQVERRGPPRHPKTSRRISCPGALAFSAAPINARPQPHPRMFAMPAHLALSRARHSSRLGAGSLALLALGIMAGPFAYGRSALEANEYEAATEVANENHDFCVGLGLGLETDAYRKCIAGLDE